MAPQFCDPHAVTPDSHAEQAPEPYRAYPDIGPTAACLCSQTQTLPKFDATRPN